MKAREVGMSDKGAMTLGESHWDSLYKIDATLTFSNAQAHRKFVLRTTLDSLSQWQSKVIQHKHVLSKEGQENGMNFDASPFERGTKDSNPTQKECAIINKELWVFDINATIANDIYQAVKICMGHFKVSAADIIGDIYVKNLNVEYENEMSAEARITANKKLYRSTCEAIQQAAKLLGVNTGSLNFWILSNIKNHKIPKEHLHEALKEAGGRDIMVSKETRSMHVLSNDSEDMGIIKNHLHLVRFYL
jgi:hypothetical protein